MSKYDEIKAIYDQSSCEAFYTALQAQTTGPGNVFNPKLVAVTPVDFIADVELAAKAALGPNEWMFFKAVYLDKQTPSAAAEADPQFAQYKHRIQELVGKMLAHREIFPIERYFRVKDLR